MILSEHLVKCDTDDRPFDTYWYKYTIGRLQQVFLAVSIKKIIIFFSWCFICEGLSNNACGAITVFHFQYLFLKKW